MGVVVRRYIDILVIIITFPYFTCISSFYVAVASLLLCSLMFYRSCILFVCISHFDTKIKLLTKAGKPNILTHMVGNIMLSKLCLASCVVMSLCYISFTFALACLTC